MSQLDELRQILSGDNTEKLAELRERIENIDARTRDVGEVLPPAIEAQLKESDRLLNALKAPVSESLKQAIRTEPSEYAEILYPVMAPSIRRAISQAISSLLITINQMVESATSVKGIGMRIESIRTGVPYAELALRRSLLYRVERVYLIDRDSGLLIAECAADNIGGLDSDAVSAMFSAIQSFVQDSFSQNVDDRLTDLKVGDHNVWVAHGSHAMLACIISGDAPESLKSQLYDTLDGIRTTYSLALASFDGDSSGFVGIDDFLKPLLQLRLKKTAMMPSKPSAGSVILILALLGLMGYLAHSYIDNKTKLSTVDHYLTQTAGIVVTSIFWEGNKIVVEGLKDPDAELPLNTLGAHGIEPEQLLLRTTPFRSLEIAMETIRIRKELNLPTGLKLVNRSGMLAMQGRVPVPWLLINDARLRQLSTDKRLDITRLAASKKSADAYAESKFSNTIDVNATDSNEEAVKELSSLLTDTAWIDVPVGVIVRLQQQALN